MKKKLTSFFVISMILVLLMPSVGFGAEIKTDNDVSNLKKFSIIQETEQTKTIIIDGEEHILYKQNEMIIPAKNMGLNKGLIQPNSIDPVEGAVRVSQWFENESNLEFVQSSGQKTYQAMKTISLTLLKLYPITKTAATIVDGAERLLNYQFNKNQTMVAETYQGSRIGITQADVYTGTGQWKNYLTSVGKEWYEHSIIFELKNGFFESKRADYTPNNGYGPLRVQKGNYFDVNAAAQIAYQQWYYQFQPIYETYY